MADDRGPTGPAHRKAERELRELALGYPEAVEEFPWGESAFKVRKKVFVFLSVNEGRFHVTTKLPDSAAFAVAHPFASPSGYGLGRSGWVTATFEPGERPPVDLLGEWIDESYRAIAPKTLVKQLDGAVGGTGIDAAPARRRR
jgi:predicted DNA-binding protein (MmcQ/YjbR family)